MDRVAESLREAAEEIVLPRFRSLGEGEIMEKAPGDLVTVADLEAERFLTARLLDLLPGSLVVGEEAYSENPDILKRFDEDRDVWVVDPVDGTVNFTKGKSTFCMMIALIRNNETQMGWIYDPTTGRMATAELGEGARINDEIPPPRKAPPFSDMIGLINSFYFEEPLRSHIREEAPRTFKEINSLSCSGHDFLSQLLGERHFSFYRRLWCWDHAPGTLMLREAGAIVDRIDEQPYRAGDRVYGLLSAPDRDTWNALLRFLSGERG